VPRQGAAMPSQWKAFVEVETCMGCGICQQVCPVGAIAIEKIVLVDAQRCIGCGRCVQECPKGALSLRISSSPAKAWPKTASETTTKSASIKGCRAYRNFRLWRLPYACNSDPIGPSKTLEQTDGRKCYQSSYRSLHTGSLPV